MFFKKGEKDSFSHYELFAIILHGDNPQSGHYNILNVKSNEQHSTDFIPRTDVTSEFWVDGNGLRKKALGIIDKSNLDYGWVEITKEEFLSERAYILDRYLLDN